jgi:exonuclease III
MNYKLCPNDTINMGLYIESEDCNSLYVKGKVILTEPINTEAIRKGYVLDNLHCNCFIKENFESTTKVEYNYTNYTEINGKFKIATYNIWGIDRTEEEKYLINKRMPLIAKEILDHNIDIICFQEMGLTSYNLLLKLLVNYTIYEKRYNNKSDRCHDVECAIAMKNFIIPKTIKMIPLGGNLTYTNSLMIIEFDNFNIYNCYLQAGSKHSIGQEKLYIHYSRCRLQLLEYIMTQLDKITPSILLGDFNINLNDTIDNYPELRGINKLINEYDFIDSWTINKDDGYTENTDINIMRWNDKMKDKKSRVDAIFTRGFKIMNSFIIGDNNYIGVDKDYESYYIKYFTPNKADTLSKIKRLNINGKLKLPIFASDHFGVVVVCSI